jgi:hypothetical protein
MMTQDTVPMTVPVDYDLDPKTGQPIVVVTPKVAVVYPGGTIQFLRRGDLGKMRLTFKAKQFSTLAVHTSPQPVCFTKAMETSALRRIPAYRAARRTCANYWT